MKGLKMPSIVHILHEGVVLCGFSLQVPRDWPRDNLWTPIRNAAGANCERCLKRARLLENDNSTAYRELADEWQLRESEQQQLIEEVVAALHHQTGDDGEDYPLVFAGIGQLIIWHITGQSPSPGDNPIAPHSSNERLRALMLFRSVVDAPIRAFCGPDNDAEWQFLLGNVLEKLIVTIRTPSSNRYNSILLRA